LSDRDDSGRDDAAIVVFSGEAGDEVLTGEVVDVGDAILPPAGDDDVRVPPIAAGAVLQAVPDVFRAMQGGKIMRLISDPEGPLNKATGGGVYASVRVESGFDNLRFRRGPENVRVVAAPAAAFQVASAVTLQYYLNTITAQLESLQRGVRDLKEWHQAEEQAEIESAEESCSEIGALLSAGTPLDTSDVVKLNDAHTVGRERFIAARIRLENLAGRIDQAVTEDGDIADPAALKETLRAATSEGVRDYLVLMRAAVLTVRALALLARHAATTDDPVRLRTTQDLALREIETMRKDLAELMPYLTRLNVRKSAIEREHTWNPLLRRSELSEELERFRAATKDLRRQLRQPAEMLLPAPANAKPWMIEARLAADGSIETRVQQLEPAVTAEASG